MDALHQAGQPALVFDIPDSYDLAAEFYRWEMATAYACAILGVNAFDQPDVQDAKDRTKAKIAEYAQRKSFNEGEVLWKTESMSAFSTLPLSGESLEATLKEFLNFARKDNYIAINAYLPRDPEMNKLLQKLRTFIGEKTCCATTVGFGPRFLHSTGQLHKGGPDDGLFLQITADPTEAVDIPSQNMTFGTLERAQALGRLRSLGLPRPAHLTPAPGFSAGLTSPCKCGGDSKEIRPNW